MQIEGIDVATKLPRRNTAGNQVLEGFHHTRVTSPERLQVAHVPGAVNVFDSHKSDEIAVFVVEVEREFDELAQAFRFVCSGSYFRLASGALTEPTGAATLLAFFIIYCAERLRVDKILA
jgi:hypothetical protein